MFNKVIVANRGAIAARVLRALNDMKIASVAVYSEADAGAPYLALAGESYCIGPAAARESYLNQQALLEIVRRSGADALHPGYGFLSENADFAARVESEDVRFIGPSPKWIDAMGHKTHARDLAARNGLPAGLGSPVLSGDAAEMARWGEEIGYPVLVKPAGGGGGIGMLVAHTGAELAGVVDRAKSMAMRGFANAEVYLERYLQRPRHIEFQLLGDRHGNVRHLFDRDCSVQRRHQKVIEEAVAPAVDRQAVDALADRIADTFARLGYDNIGTVEMLMGADGRFSFLEVNTRLQVEHGVTEEVTGVDLVRAQIKSAAGLKLDEILPATIEHRGHAIQARVYAEDSRRFFPSPGPLTVFRPPSGTGVRVETGYAEGRNVTPFYDPLLAKVIARGDTREGAIDTLLEALRRFEIVGVKTNLAALETVLASEPFRRGDVHTGLIPELIK